MPHPDGGLARPPYEDDDILLNMACSYAVYMRATY